MCTMSWLRDGEDYHVFFNRDELRRRRTALPPRIHERAGVRYVAPIDGDSHGTWIAANEHGVTVCLLNGYTGDDAAPPDRDYTSRGHLVASLADSGGVEEIRDRLNAVDLTGFRSFWLAALAPRDQGLLARWARGRFEVEPCLDEQMPLVSSSFETDAVRRARTGLFRERGLPGPDADAHLAYHRGHVPEAGPYSVCMHRPDAETVSVSHVAVGTGAVVFEYEAGPPHEAATGIAVSLPRRAEVF